MCACIFAYIDGRKGEAKVYDSSETRKLPNQDRYEEGEVNNRDLSLEHGYNYFAKASDSGISRNLR